MPLKVREVIRLLEQNGWKKDRLKGKGRGKMNATRYAIIIERGRTSYGAYSPDVPGCVAAADTEEEVRKLIAEAIEFHIEGWKLRGEPVPQPTSTVDYVEVAA